MTRAKDIIDAHAANIDKARIYLNTADMVIACAQCGGTPDTPEQSDTLTAVAVLMKCAKMAMDGRP